MKLVLIRAIGNKTGDYLPSLGLGYIKSYLKKHISGIEIVITNSLEELIKANPDIVAISSVTQNFNIAIKIAEEVKDKLRIPIIIGGQHISALPHTLPSCFDIGVIGEGEETMRELMQYYIYKREGIIFPLYPINGIVINNFYEIIITEPRPQIERLDSLPYPYRGKIKEDYAHMVTSRGCPYKCIFCSSSRFWGNVRYFSAEYVVNEMKQLIKDNPHLKEILLWDDLFIGDRNRLKAIVAMILESGIYRNVSFECTVRANLVDEELCELLRMMNVKVVSMGLESGCNRTLKYLKQGNVTAEDNRNAVLLLKKYGFVIRSSFIIGCPNETADEIGETFDFVKNNPIDLGATYLLMPLPGTDLWNYALKKGLVSLNMDWSRFNAASEDETSIIMSETLTQSEILMFHSIFKREWERKAAVFDATKPKNINLSSVWKAITHPYSTVILLKNLLNYHLMR